MKGPLNVARPSEDNLKRDLIRLVGGIADVQGELASLMRERLDAVRRADTERMQEITSREGKLLDRANEREGLRRQVVRQLLVQLGRDPEQHSGITLTELAEFLPEPRRSELLAAAAGLRRKLEDIEQVRVASALVTEEMLKHVGEVLSVARGGGRRLDLYSPSGRFNTLTPANVFEAVG